MQSVGVLVVKRIISCEFYLNYKCGIILFALAGLEMTVTWPNLECFAFELVFSFEKVEFFSDSYA